MLEVWGVINTRGSDHSRAGGGCSNSPTIDIECRAAKVIALQRIGKRRLIDDLAARGH